MRAIYCEEWIMEQMGVKTIFEQLEGLDTDQLEYIYFTIEAVLKERDIERHEQYAKEND